MQMGFFLPTFFSLDGVNGGLAKQEKEFCAVSDCRILLLRNRHCQSASGVVNWYSPALLTACSFCNAREVVSSYFAGGFLLKRAFTDFFVVALCHR